jgi:glucose/arabinose dehydrogenase
MSTAALSFPKLRTGSALVLLLAAGCGGRARLPLEAGVGPHPELPAPRRSLIPTVNVVTARGWPAGTTPHAAEGLRVTAFARGLEHPRWLLVLPNGDVLVAETNAPNRPDDATGIKGWLFKHFQKKAGGAVPSANRITLLRDTTRDGVADVRTVLLSGLSSPFGMALLGDALIVANTDALVRFPFRVGETHISAAGTVITPLPAGRRNHHWTKNVVASPDGQRLYVAVGSNSNAAENGIDAEWERASIWEVNPQDGSHRLFATGLRNPVGMAWEPAGGRLWTAVNERDELGGDLVPDYLTAVHEHAFYGWPYSYFGAHVDTRVSPRRPDLVTAARVPDYALGAHTASLGLAWSPARANGQLPVSMQRGMFVGQHGSWNRTPRSGYKVIFVPFADGMPAGTPRDVLTGFVTDGGGAMGRPVGVAVDARGALYVADDVGNTVWRVVAQSVTAATSR